MPLAPASSITLLCTDIEGSTRLWERDPAAMRMALARHDQLLHQIIAAHNGQVLKTAGDAFYAAFNSAPAALAAALAIQRTLATENWGALGAVRVRIALHSASASASAEQLGSLLNHTVRLLAAGHGGQVLLSQAASALVRQQLPAGASLSDLGERRLKDLTQPEHVYQLLVPDLPAAFPPLNTLDTHSTNLPIQHSALVGREQELADVLSLLRRADVRLLTLTGPGGTGKTRLALQAAADLIDEFKDGVFLVALSAVLDPNLVAPSIAKVLSVKEGGDQPLVEQLQNQLRGKQQLLVLDNFEQVLGAAALIADLLAAAPQLKLLITSRAVLRIYGEHDYPVPPLPLPNIRHFPPHEAIIQSPAVSLFVQRAQSVKPDFVLTREHAPMVAAICARLDGLPLAIELAASRVALLPVPTILQRLENRLQTLDSGSQELPARQRTLRGTLDWSYNLLTPDEQPLFARLSVFVGGCTLEAAEAICSGALPALAGAETGAGRQDAWSSDSQTAPSISELDILDGLASLVDKSLLRQQDVGELQQGSEPRFVMLDTVREYAAERLEASGESVALHRRHAEYYLALAEQAQPALNQRQGAAMQERVAREHDNLRAAVSWALQTGEQTLALRLVGALWPFWQQRGYLSEGRRWLAATLAQSAPASALRAWALLGSGVLGRVQDDYAHARACYTESLALYRQLDDDQGMAQVLLELGRVARFQAQYDEAERYFAESMALFRQLNDTGGLAAALNGLGIINYYQDHYARANSYYEEALALYQQLGDLEGVASSRISLGHVARYQANYEGAQRYFSEGLALFRQLGDIAGIGSALNSLGLMLLYQGDSEQARHMLEESLAIRRSVGDRWGSTYSLNNLALVAYLRGDREHSRALYTESLSLCRELDYRPNTARAVQMLGLLALEDGDLERAQQLLLECLELREGLRDQAGMAEALELLAGLAGATEHPLRAARLFGAAEALRQAIGAYRLPTDQLSYDRLLAQARASTDEQAFQQAWHEGQQLKLHEALAYAREA